MNENYRGARGVEKLLRLARAETQSFRIDLEDIEAAKQATQAALSELDNICVAYDQKDTERTQVILPGHADALQERRLNLKKTLCSLEGAAEDARGKLVASQKEIQKLEHLTEINANAVAVSLRRREQAETDDAAAASVMRRKG
ncbi:MAG: hypothetical protein AAGD92_08170 [Pseudomonadota bacterium]